MDLSFVTARLATGAMFVEQDLEALVAAGITDVINCAVEDTGDVALLAAHPSVTVLTDGTADDGEPKPPEWFAKGIEFALEVLAKPNRKVYAHCVGGANRGPSMTYAILRAMGLNAQTAEQLIRNARPQVGLRYKGDADRAVVELGFA